jgi:CubicO group peptidase (beta-lactamase class C family)
MDHSTDATSQRRALTAWHQKRLVLRTLLLGLALASSPAVAAERPDFSGLTRAIQTFKETTAYPSGTAVIVLRDGKIAYEGYFGQTDLGAKTPVTRDSVFYIASATKPFVALDTLLAEHEGRLDKRTTLQAMFPQARFPDVDASAITARDLLTHTSGLDNEALVWATAFSGVHDARSRLQLIAASVPNAEAPHGTFDYSNVGYNIASEWLDRVDGRPWQSQLAARILAPLGMRHSTARVSEARARHWPLALPYSFIAARRGVPLYLRKDDATMHAAGGLLSTAPDLARFLLAQLDDGRLGRTQVLPASVIRQSHERQATTDSHYLDFARDGYAWGWYIGDYKGRRMLHHFGAFAGFHAHLSFIPAARVGLVVLNNEDALSARLTSLIADYAYGLALGEDAIDTKAAARFAQLARDARDLEQKVARQHATIAARAWRLSLPRDAYAGRYRHPLLGDIEIDTAADGTLALHWGQLTAAATGYDQPEQVRIEFVPGSGEVMRFELAHGQVEALVLDHLVFRKVPLP